MTDQEKQSVAEAMRLMAEAVELSWKQNPRATSKILRAIQVARRAAGVSA